jgi:secretion/DNA translocation related TadE-like protein
VSIFVAVFVVVAMLLGTALAKFAGAVVEKSRANTAADASALAAADGLALGWSPADACTAARSTASDNGARVVTCRTLSASGGTLTAEVVLQLDDAQARARAEVGTLQP